MSYRRSLFLALTVLTVSWSSWILFCATSLGFGMSEAALELLGDTLSLVGIPLRDGHGNPAESPRFSHVPMPGGHTLPSQAPSAGDATLPTFSEIFVVSLSARADRRATMERIRSAVPLLNFSYFDATPADDSRISAIYDRIKQTREAYGTSSRTDATFEWPRDVSAPSRSPLGQTGADLWTTAALTTETSAFSTATRSGNYGTILDPFPRTEPLTCASQNYVSGPPYSLALPPYQLLTRSKVACWHSHVEVLRAIAGRHDGENADTEVSLILEDDIDVERDVQKRLQSVWGAMPERWDMLFLDAANEELEALACPGYPMVFPVIDSGGPVRLPEHGPAYTENELCITIALDCDHEPPTGAVAYGARHPYHSEMHSEAGA
ncbi:uncharacterized protein PHACADRAFT_203830 [Phanerochaete carnosa HHB-10118-sp]|uniref:Glycosyltransferase family 25 protein n=1 Tax=Phanerochaete carnosa (strain HHB-10118-sp) TaxID=650164 RepID=K5WN80_PHACS|nr:uncharacterized protein PHACADRAFT_203830 [Phanerochaete carnosa HHB-10118-sp]EKM60674.1 hypothetical protein PHACADRAFT_203830 [Phanerochaete carnosa HHB-10118-sp]